MARLYILLTLAFVAQLSLISVNATTKYGTSCPSFKWTHYGGFCYLYSNRKEQWYQARSICRSYIGWPSGVGDLVSIHSEEEQNFVYQMWKSSREYVANPSSEEPGLWIGLNDLITEGRYQWRDNTRNDYFNWAPGEPNDRNGEDVVDMLDYGSKAGGKWNDHSALHRMNYMCKLKANPWGPG